MSQSVVRFYNSVFVSSLIPILFFLSLNFKPIECGLLDGCFTEACGQFKTNRSLKQGARIKILEHLRKNYLENNILQSVRDLPFQELIGQLQSRQLSAVQALSLFISRAVNATMEFNCVTEFVPDAMKWAIELDELPIVKGPLHGLPFCVKDDHQIEGMDSTLGLSRNLYKPANSTATLVKILKDLGAIPFCKTNLPQALASFGSDNPIFGTTLNPLNKKLSPGGSSSGSGCIVGSKAIPFATGTDSMGSGRLPAHFNGIASIMPTSRRLSFEGITNALPRMIGINAVPAIFADKPSTVKTIFKALTENNVQNSNDPTTVPISWNIHQFEESRRLRFGYVTSIPFFPTMGDTPLVIDDTKRILQSLGHSVVPFEMPDGHEYMKIMFDFLLADGGSYYASLIQNDDISKSINTMYWGLKFPNWQKRLAGLMPMSDRMKIILRSGLDTEKTTGLQAAVEWTRNLRRDILRRMKEDNLDLILTPVFPTPAVRLDDPPYLLPAVCYTALWNLVDFPAGVIPMGVESGRHLEAPDTNGDMFIELAKKSLQEAVGMPIGVQIVGKPFNEELILNAMCQLEDSVKPATAA